MTDTDLLPDDEFDDSAWPSTLDVQVPRVARPARPHEVADRLQKVESQVTAATAQAENANATAQDLARSMRDAAPGRDR